MKNTFKSFSEISTSVSFGKIDSCGETEQFYNDLCNRVTLLIRSLPESLRNEALLLYMQYSGITIGDQLHFFKNYYSPTWSILYWIEKEFLSPNKLSLEEYDDIQTAQAMAMILHSLDDHLNDGDIPCSHLTLLIRSQAWHLMKESLARLTENSEEERELVDTFINDYYDSIVHQKAASDLDHYCTVFRKQMATGSMVPYILARRATKDLSYAVELIRAHESFGIAWRLLDDIQDIEEDYRTGTESSLYLLLDDKGKSVWKSPDKDNNSNSLLSILNDNKIIEMLKERIKIELVNASAISGKLNLTGLSNEYRNLGAPFIDKSEKTR